MKMYYSLGQTKVHLMGFSRAFNHLTCSSKDSLSFIALSEPFNLDSTHLNDFFLIQTAGFFVFFFKVG